MSVHIAIKVFLAHASDDQGLASLVAQRLDDAGCEVEPFSSHRPGDEYESQLRKAIRNADRAIFLVTRQFAESTYLGLEIGAARMAEKPIYVLFDGMPESELPDYLKHFEVVPVTELSRLIDETTQAA